MADHGESWASLGEFGRVHGGPRRVLRRIFHTGRHFRSIGTNFAKKGRVPQKSRPVRLDKIAVLLDLEQVLYHIAINIGIFFIITNYYWVVGQVSQS